MWPWCCGVTRRSAGLPFLTTFRSVTKRTRGQFQKLPTAPRAELQNNPSVSFKRNAARGSLNLSKPASLSRSYASISKDDEDPTETSYPSSKDSTPTPEMYLKVLEQAAYAPWVAQEHTAADKSSLEDKLSRAYIRTFNIFMFLGRPQDEQAALAFLTAFQTATVDETNDITKARDAITILIRTIVRDLTSIPLNSELRTKHAEIFAIFGALVPLHDAFIADGNAPGQPEWSEFWSKTQLILLELGAKLDQAGYGIKPDEKQ